MQSLGITEVCVNTLALLDINSPKMTAAKASNGYFLLRSSSRRDLLLSSRAARFLLLALTSADS